MHYPSAFLPCRILCRHSLSSRWAFSAHRIRFYSSATRTAQHLGSRKARSWTHRRDTACFHAPAAASRDAVDWSALDDDVQDPKVCEKEASIHGNSEDDGLYTTCQGEDARRASITKEIVKVKVNNGEVSLEIYRPSTSSDAALPLILYLPSLPSPTTSADATSSPRSSCRMTPALYDASTATRQVEKEAHQAQALALAAQATVVKINYRALSYPQPIHDVLAGYDYCVKHLLPQHQHTASTSNTSNTAAIAGIAVYGELVGGSLAVMLGLTECDTGSVTSPSRSTRGASWGRDESDEDKRGKPYIKAVAVKDAVVDWVSPSTASSSSSQHAEPALHSGKTDTHNDLRSLRNQLFRARTHPSTYFDPFASPIHFLRTPAADVPEAIWPTAAEVITKKVEEASEAVEDMFDVLAELEAETAEVLRPTLSSDASGDERRKSEAHHDASTGDAEVETSTAGAARENSHLPQDGSHRNDKGGAYHLSRDEPSPSMASSTPETIDTTRRRIPLKWPPSALPPTTRMPYFNISSSSVLLATNPGSTISRKRKSKKQEADERRSKKEMERASPPPLIAQGHELARLLRRAWVKYCFPRQAQPSLRNDEMSSRRRRYIDPDDEDADDSDESGAETEIGGVNALALSRSSDKILDRLVLKDIMNDDGEVFGTKSGDAEDPEEEALRKQANVLKKLARERVGWHVVRPATTTSGKNAHEYKEDEGGLNSGDTDIERLGEWMGYWLRKP